MAVLLVVVGHVGVGALSGGYVGVDVFFVLSGFFITGLLLADVERHGLVSFRDFYVRRVKRILPAAALALVVTDVVAYVLLNVVRARMVMQDSFWAVLFAANVRFAREGTDYFAQAQLPSPIQHYWSLAVEEQYYLVWPTIMSVVLFGVLRTVRRRRLLRDVAAARSRLLAALTAVFLASLAWSVHESTAARAAAYFSPLTRAWEIALGALIAIAAPTLSEVSRRLRSNAAVAGLAAIGVAAAMYDETTAYPGWHAMLPTAGAALVIVGGLGDARPTGAVSRLLALRPLRYVGDRSYSLYLWHWPALMLAAQYEGRYLSVGVNLLLLLLAFGISILTYSTFENPLRHRAWTPRKAAALAIASIGGVLAVGGVLNALIDQESRGFAAEGAPSLAVGVYRGNVLPLVRRSVAGATHRIDAAVLRPPVTRLSWDAYTLPRNCAADPGDTRSNICRLGRASSRRTLVVFGDSHAQMWMPAVLATAKQDAWSVVPLVKVGCAPLDWELQSGSDCRRWFKWAVQTATSLHPSVLLVAGHYTGEDLDRETQGAHGIQKVVAAIDTAERAVALVDTSIQREDPVDCLLRRGATQGRCSLTIDRDAAVADESADAVLSHSEGLRVIDPRPWLCSQNVCPMVIGNTIAYSDRGHLSMTYVSQLADVFRSALASVLRQR